MSPEKKKSETGRKKPEEQGAPAEARVEERAEALESGVERGTAHPLDEFLGRTQKAYAAYLEAQRDVWRAFQETAERAEGSFEKEKEEASKTRDEVIGRALASRRQAGDEAERVFAEAIQAARDTYQKSREQAEKACEDNVGQAIAAYEQVVNRAWEMRKGAFERAWSIFSKQA